MEGQYNIVINIKTTHGMMEIGNFFIGDDREFAIETFNQLKGSDNKDWSVLWIDLIKENKWPPHDCLKSLVCTLDEYVENCRIITRNAFKFFTIENNGFNTFG